LFPNPLGEDPTRFSRSHDPPPTASSERHGQNSDSIYRTPESNPQSFHEPHLPLNHFEYWDPQINETPGDYLSPWSTLDSTICPVPPDSLSQQTGFGAPGLDNTFDLLVDSAQGAESIFPQFDTISETKSSLEQSPNQGQLSSRTLRDHPWSDTFIDPFTPAELNSTLRADSSNSQPSSRKLKTAQKSSPKHDDADNLRIQKRTLNTIAARRYRQKRFDQMAELEAALKETRSERDALKVRVARLEGEVDVLRGLLRR